MGCVQRAPPQKWPCSQARREQSRTIALAYERTRMLAAPMGVHALYNAAVLGFQRDFMQI
jgi:hypothetical protein